MIRRKLRNRVSSRNSNKRLYESIMKDVAKTVKKHLNEGTPLTLRPYKEYEPDSLEDYGNKLFNSNRYFIDSNYSNKDTLTIVNDFIKYLQTDELITIIYNTCLKYNIIPQETFIKKNNIQFKNFDFNLWNPKTINKNIFLKSKSNPSDLLISSDSEYNYMELSYNLNNLNIYDIDNVIDLVDMFNEKFLHSIEIELDEDNILQVVIYLDEPNKKIIEDLKRIKGLIKRIESNNLN